MCEQQIRLIKNDFEKIFTNFIFQKASRNDSGLKAAFYFVIKFLK
jgi:hypothetical protein